ncbi:MAG: oligosaccharide flippase family protein [Candidatus Pacebacteria bacterium]|nr:oligosaccharide flippase family protein [Candidatus Paceibacterota bacterium]
MNINSKAHTLIKRGNKYFKTDLSYLLKNGSWLFAGQIISILSLLLLAMVFAQKLSPETYGTYKYILSTIGIFASISLSGLGITIIQSTAKGFEGLFRKSPKIYLKWSLPFFVLTLGGAVYYYLQGNMILAGSLAIGSILSPIFQSFNFFPHFLMGKKDFKTNTFLSISKNIFITIALIAVLFTTKNLFILIVAYFLLHTIFNVCAYFYTSIKYKPNKNLSGEELSYAKHLSLMNILVTIAMHIDSILIFHFLGATQLAVYSFAILIPEQIKGILKNLTSLVLPKYSKNSLTTIKKNIQHKMFLLGITISLIIYTYILLAPSLYKLLFPIYTSSILYSQFFSIGLLGIIASLPIAALQAHTSIKELYKLNTFFSVIKILLLITLTPFYGIWGALASILITRISTLALSYYLFIKKD